MPIFGPHACALLIFWSIRLSQSLVQTPRINVRKSMAIASKSSAFPFWPVILSLKNDDE